MQSLRLRFTSPNAPEDIPLEVGMHHIGHVDGRDGGLGRVAEGTQSSVCFCVDRRGVWLTVGEGGRGVHVNGREVRRLAMLRVGDAVYVDGQEIRLVGDRVPAAPRDEPAAAADAGAPDPRIVLRGIGGRHHGRCFTLDRPRLVGRVPEADIRIEDPAFPDRHARVELAGGKVRLRDLGSEEGSLVNGESVRDALLMPGDQVVFDAHHRFVVEAPMREGPQPSLSLGEVSFDFEPDPPPAAGTGGASRSLWRLPWLLLAALLIAGLLSLLLLYGAV